MNRWRRLICGFYSACLILIMPLAVTAEPYRLGPEDVISLRVATWDDATAGYVMMEAITGEYEVSSDGVISLPVVGSVIAEGETPENLSVRVAEGLRSTAGLFQLPVVALQIVQYRPIYITGDVSNPGSFPWRPQLTSNKAIALAGGIVRTRLDSFDETSGFRDINSLQSVQVELARFITRVSRLEAELNEAPTIEFSAGLFHPDGPDLIAGIQEEERLIFEIRHESRERAAQSNEALIELYETELTGLLGKLEGQQRRLVITREHLEKLTALVEIGTVPANRLIAVEQALVDQNAEELDLNTAIFRARQRIGETQRDLLQIADNNRQQVMTELQKARHDIVLLGKREEMLIGLAAMSGVAPINTTFVTEMRVRRTQGETVVVLATGPDDPILPGDVLEVTLKLEMSSP